jgi:signal transduction histidine kinase
MLVILLLLLLITSATYSWFRYQTTRQIHSQQMALLTSVADGLDDKLHSAHIALQRVAGVFPEQYRSDSVNAQRWLHDRTGIRSIFSDGLYLVGADGIVLAENDTAGVLKNKPFSCNHGLDAVCFSSKSCISRPYLCSVHKTTSILMTAPIVAADGRTVATLVGAINIKSPKSFFQTLVSEKTGVNGFLLLLDQQQTILAHRDQSRVQKTINRSFQDLIASGSTNGRGGSGEFTNFYGIPSIASFKPLSSTGIVVASVLPQQEAYAPITRFRNGFLAGIVVILLVAAAAIRLLTRSVTAGLEQLTASIEQIDPKNLAEAKLSTVQTGDEVERLAAAFNALLQEAGTAQQEVLQGKLRLLRDISEREKVQQELIESRHAAEAANRAKSDFLANMSHEIRTPLNGVMGMSQLLQTTSLDSEQAEYLGYLDTSASNLLALLNDILDLSKIEAGKLEIEQTAFSLRAAIEQVLTPLLPRIRQKGLLVNTEPPAGLPDQLIGDPLRLKQILLNLLGNAVKFTEKGSVQVSASLVAETGEFLLLRLKVSDTGIGMTAEQLERIFAPFEQADNSITRLYGGSGLGLTICSRLAELMGGRIWAESEQNKGSRFFVELPFRIPEQQPAIVHQQIQPVVAAPTRQLNILVAEDNSLNATTLVAMLKIMGHQSAVATDGRKALDLWSADGYDCILMDVSMPIMDGRLATAAIREQESMKGGHIPIIAVTARAMQGDREQLLAEGFDGYVSKPIMLKQLQETIEQVVARFRA